MTNALQPPFAAVIGDPIAHSLSPALHAFWLQRAGVRGTYAALRFEADGSTFPAKIAALQTLGARGVNVTTPHKDRALQIADDIEEGASAVGAANMLTFTEAGRIVAANSDVAGVRTPVERVFPDISASRVLIVGAGGAARAAAVALRDAGALSIANRTRSKAEEVAGVIGGGAAVRDIDTARGENFDLVVNATTLGMRGGPSFPEHLCVPSAGGAFFEMVYNPLRTKAAARAEGAGRHLIDGLDMLIAQAAEAARRWFGIEPAPADETKAMLIRLLEARA
ncbi:MAG: shikimate dehydrogenase [Pseudomonadota bacterium]